MKPEALYNLFASHEEGAWIMRPSSAKALCEYVKSKKPKKVLDLGTGIGCTSALLASLGAEVHTVEQNEKCIEVARGIIPEELQEKITFYHKKAIVWESKEIPHLAFSAYEELPEGDYDMWLVDGPGPWQEGEHIVDLMNADVLKSVDSIRAGTIVVWDGRVTGLRNLERYYGDNFYFILNPPKTDMNILERKDNKAILRDAKLQGYRDSRYI